MASSRRALVLLALVNFLVFTSFLMVESLFALYVFDDLGYAEGLVGPLVIAFSVSALVMKFPLGLYVPTSRAKLLLIAGLVLMALVPAGYALWGDTVLLTPMRLLNGVGFSMLTIASLTYAARSSKSVAWITVAISTGLLAGPTVSATLVDVLGIENMFLIAGAVAALASLVGTALPSSAEDSEPAISSEKVAVGLLLGGPIFVVLVASLAYNYALGAIIAYAPVHGKLAFGLGEADVAFLFLVFNVVLFVSRTSFARWGVDDTLSLLLTALISGAVGMLGMALAPDTLLFAVAFAVSGFAQGVVFPTTTILVTEEVDKEERVVGISALTGTQDLGIVAGGLLSAPIAASVGSGMALLLAALAPTAGFVYLLLRRGRGGEV